MFTAFRYLCFSAPMMIVTPTSAAGARLQKIGLEMRRFGLFAAKIVVTLAMLYLALRGTDFENVMRRLQNAHLGWIAAAIIFVFVQVFLATARWREVAIQCDAFLPIRRGVRFSMIAAFLNQVLPSTIGGDALRVWMFARSGAGWSKSAYSVLLDRFFGILSLALMVTVCLPWSLSLIKNPVGRLALVAIGAASIGGALVFVAIGYLRWHKLMEWAPTRHLIQMSITMRQVLFSIRATTTVITLSVSVHLISVAVAWCVAQSVDARFHFDHALLLLPPVLLIASVPISIAGWGVRETAFVLAFSYAGLQKPDGLVISVLFGTAFFVVGLAGGLTWLLSAEPKSMPPVTSSPPNA